ncbi:hypothetical protein FXO38_02540 [Capsicum annuum]|nr:hypothetical protein FXO37_32564 [Capsicum annuum]KAF3679908.1 hypothetical protein FXO38_02540 [Capsicum annuum]
MMEPLLVIASTVVFAELELHSSRISLIIWFNVEVPNGVRYHQVKSGKTLADTVLNAECCLGGKLEKLVHWNDDEQGPNNQDGGANEQVPNEQDGDVNEQPPNEQDIGANEQNVYQDEGANGQVPNDQEGAANEVLMDRFLMNKEELLMSKMMIKMELLMNGFQTNEPITDENTDIDSSLIMLIRM